MIRLAIVEDDPDFTAQLKDYCRRFEEDNNIELSAIYYSDGDEIVREYSSQFDIILMDIQMKFMNGMEAAEEIRKVDKKVEILFITNLAQYAIKGYEVGALDYILKPLSFFNFSQKLIRAINRIEKRKESYVTFSVKGGIQRMELSAIYYIESEGHNLIYHTREGSFVSTGTMKSTEETFADKHFARANKGCLVNLEKVEAIRDRCAVIKGTSIGISRPRYETFMKEMTDYWSGGH